MLSAPRSRNPILLVLAALACAITYHAGANRPIAPKPVSVGTVKLGEVLEQINSRDEWAVKLKSMSDKLTAEKKNREESINVQREALKALADGPERTAAREKVAMEILEAEAWMKWETLRMDRERSLMWQDLYHDIKAEADKLATAEGLDLVLINDSLGDVKSIDDPKLSAEAIVLQQITARRVLFATKEIDLTDRLITRMNNAATTAGAAKKGT